MSALIPGIRVLAVVFIGFALALALAPVTAHAASFTVNSTADEEDASPGNGVCASAGGNCTLRAAIQEANTLAGADAITLPAGTYVLNRGSGDDNAANGDLDITSVVTITGAGARTTIVDGNALDRIFDIRGGGTASISGLRITNGSIPGGDGGGVRVEGTLTFTEVSVAGNTSKNGGGIANTSGTTTLLSVTLRNNSAVSGDGGGFQSNSASPFNYLTNVTISGNSATGNGGGIECDHGVLLNVTVTANTSPNDALNKRGGQPFTLKNTILAGNASPAQCTGGGSITSLGFNIGGDAACGLTGPGDLPNTNPLIGPLQDNGGPTDTHALLAGSPAIDAGTNTGAPATDQRGVARPVDGNGDTIPVTDIGAFELAVWNIGGRVFEDANFAGTASNWDGGAADLGLANVDVEVYDAGTNAYIASATTGAGGTYTLGGLANGSYKVRARSATIGDADTPPKGALNASVPATWPYPLAEMTWGNTTARYGGQSPTVDDAATGDNAGPGDTYTTVTVSGADVTNVHLGFAYNLIVNADDDSNAGNARSKQGGLRQFIKNANAIGAAGGTTANTSQFRMQVATNQSSGPNAWWRIAPAIALPDVADAGAVLDGSTQRANSGADNNALGPEIELDGTSAGAANGLRLTAGTSTVRELVINRFGVDGVAITGGSAHVVTGNYVGANATGTAALGNFDDGIDVKGTSNVVIGGSGAADRNVISGQANDGIYIEGPAADGGTIRGNYIGLNASGTGALGNGDYGIRTWSTAPTGPSNYTIGGTAAGQGNTIAFNGNDGVWLDGPTGTGNSLLRNAIHSNGGLGIDLTPNGLTGNDPGDTDTGLNDLLNFPVPVAAVAGGGTATVDFDLDVPAGTYRIEFFRNPLGADPSGNGEGEVFAGTANVTHPGGGTQRYSHTFAGNAGDVLTSTATVCTDGAACTTFGSTSEFGPAMTAQAVSIVKRAFLLDGTPIPSTTVVPRGKPVRFLLYVNNPGGAITDVTLRDALDPAFAYQTGSIRYSDVTPACGAGGCDAAAEAAIYAAASTGTSGTDGVDGDAVSYSAAELHAGNQNAGNAQLDVPAGKVWAIVFTTKWQ